VNGKNDNEKKWNTMNAPHICLPSETISSWCSNLSIASIQPRSTYMVSPF